MSGYPNGDWHTANGGALPFRPPTVDEALPYSPFTSIVPFSPDVIPFPVNEPPTPPTTLTPDQQAAGRKAVGILNEEIRGPASTAHHLEHTLRELRNLLGDPREMTEFHFKPTTQLATPPPDSPSKSADESTPTSRPKLSPFASMLLRQTDVHYKPVGTPAPQRSKSKQEPPRPHVSTAPPRRPSQQATPKQNITSYEQNNALAYLSNTPVPSSTSSQSRSGPAVVIKPSSAPKHEFRLIENVPSSPTETQAPNLDYLATLQPAEREKAEQKIHKLRKLVGQYREAKDDLENEHFEKISTLDSDITVMTSDALKLLYDRVMAVYATKCFSSVPVETIVQIHSLCDPLIAISDQASLFTEEELDTWTRDLATVESGLKAARLALTAMLEGPQDRRTTSEDLLTAIIGVMKRVLESCIFPVLAASRNHSIFTYASDHRPEISTVLRLCTSVEELLAQTVRRVTLPDSALNAVEFLALTLLVHPNSDSEKDSALGIQHFERLRRAAMDVLVNIFAFRPDHQQYVLDEILNSLEKLPDKGPNTRQFKSVREEPIMTVSAIFMEFVQVAATNTQDQRTKATSDPREEDSSHEDKSESDNEEDRPAVRKNRGSKANASAEATARRLMHTSQLTAHKIASRLTERAKNVTKSGEKPFRNLLDMFVDDFCKVLGSPEWPAANLLLVPLFNLMYQLRDDKENRNMAISILGTMGGGILDFKKRTRQLRRDIDVSQSDLSAKLYRLTEEILEDDGTELKKSDLLALNDPYRMVVESLPDYLKVNDNPEDLHLLSVRGCYVSCWLDSISQVILKDKEAADDKLIVDLRRKVQSMVLEPKWSSQEYKYKNVSESQSRLASGAATVKNTFCRCYPSIVAVMFQQVTGGGAQQKTNAIRNIDSFLTKDPHSISDRHVNLLLISRCLESNPALGQLCMPSVLRMTTDTHNEPKKRAINLLKTFYTRSDSLETKIQIVIALLPASQDHEKTVADMARQALEEVWLKVLATKHNGDENRLKLQRVERVSLIVQTVRRTKKLPSTSSTQALEKFFSTALAKGAPNASVNFQICKDLVADLVEGVISPDSMTADYTQEGGLQTLSIFARVSPEMFTLDQIERLKLYIIDPKTTEDIEILNSTVTVYRFVIPHLPDLPTKFADDVWKLLNVAISKLARAAANGNILGKNTLLGIGHCLWIMKDVPTNGLPRLLALIGSILVQLLQAAALSGDPSTQEVQKARIMSWLIIIGTFGKVCDWSGHVAQFHTSVANSAKKIVASKPAGAKQLKSLLDPKGSEPSVILLEAVRPFTKQPWDLAIRESAMCAVGEVCQGSPTLFQRSDVDSTFKVVFKNDINSLKQIVLTQFLEFFSKKEGQSEEDTTPVGDNATNGSGRLGITFRAGDGQIPVTYLARKFLQEVIDIALHNDNELALVATKIIVSVSKQGLDHPKEVGPALIAIGSSPNPLVSVVAAHEHKSIHSKHESVFEKEYMVAIKMSFQYQQDVFQDPHGMTKPPDCKPKLAHVFNVMKDGSRKTLKRFIDNLSKLIDFKLSDLVDPAASLDALLLARFCLENLALFDVAKVEDVSLIITALESIVLKNTGPSVGVAIETEMPKKDVPVPQQPQLLPDATGSFMVPDVAMQDAMRDDHVSVSDDRLLQITRACMILQMMWETRCFVRKAYNIKANRISPKIFQNSAGRNNLIKGADLWEKFAHIFNAVETRRSMIDHCYDFSELLEVDRDFAVGDEDGEDEDGMGYATPEENDEQGMPVPTSGRGRKRKTSASLTNTPKRAKGRPSGSKNKKRNSKTPEWDDGD
ncbi:Sister chromatid cohesion protein 2 [Didymosphaeria variabile]|uniref:Sister chromatid cohesion protein n=1 Tax=Didymosphaeria variabile TaxID=1932322 RepID=A0A9W8XLQ3_9PLEO|nr:Sister chromatid cohesion protein 2 [Didymosphaeria variabile]KAJ4352383.1 Sister chromatid cohesion protein 2 [Didymosphaeria variabile]